MPIALVRRLGHHLIGRAEIRFALRDVLADARKSFEHRRLLIGGQVDQFTAVFRPTLERLIFDFDRLRIHCHRLAGAIPIDDLLQILGQRLVPFPVDFDDDEDRRLMGHGDIFRRVKEMHTGEDLDARDRAVDGALLERRQYVAERHRHRRGAEPLQRNRLEVRSENPNLLALEIGEMADRRFCDDLGPLGHEQADAAQALVGAEPEHQLHQLRICGDLLALLHGVDEGGCGQHAKAIVEADHEFRRHHLALDGAELRALDLPRNRAQLARRVDFRLDAAAGILLQRGGVVPGKSVGRSVHGGSAYLHHVSLALCLRRAERQRQRHGERTGGDSRPCRSACWFDAAHVVLPLGGARS